MKAYSKESYHSDGFQIRERIYVLKNRLTNEVFYIGRTKKPLANRLHGHISAAKGKADKFTNAIKDEYIRKLISENNKPCIESIETVIPISYIEYLEIAERELYWMKYFKESGVAIMNIMGLRIPQPNAKYLWYLEMKDKNTIPIEYYYCGKDILDNNLYHKERMILDGLIWEDEYKKPAYNPFTNWRWKMKVGLP